jgi:hypothetical protein
MLLSKYNNIIIIILNSKLIFFQKLKESPNSSNNYRNYSVNNTRSSNRTFNRHPICNECVIEPNLPMLDLKDNNKLDLPPTYDQVMNIGKKT